FITPNGKTFCGFNQCCRVIHVFKLAFCLSALELSRDWPAFRQSIAAPDRGRRFERLPHPAREWSARVKGCARNNIREETLCRRCARREFRSSFCHEDRRRSSTNQVCRRASKAETWHSLGDDK